MIKRSVKRNYMKAEVVLKGRNRVIKITDAYVYVHTMGLIKHRLPKQFGKYSHIRKTRFTVHNNNGQGCKCLKSEIS
jgi:hypothetical protein